MVRAYCAASLRVNHSVSVFIFTPSDSIRINLTRCNSIIISFTQFSQIGTVRRVADFVTLNLIHKLLVMTTNDKKQRNTNNVDATGLTVAANVKRLRGGLSFPELSRRLSAVGRPLPVIALRRIEEGNRNVTVDDLMAFAIVFGVSPLTLLMPEYASRDITTRITGYPEQMGSNVAWLWARGDEPLELPQDPALGNHAQNDRAIALFRLHSVPTIDKRDTITPVADWVPRDASASEIREQEQNMAGDALMLSRAQLVRPASNG